MLLNIQIIKFVDTNNFTFVVKFYVKMKKYLIITAILGALTIILGAFGAHALNEMLNATELKSFETAVRYQMYHVLLLLAVNLYDGFKTKTQKSISNLIFAGVLCFSGSIYAITFGVDAKYIWYVTPIGGLLLILGWLKLAFSFLKKSK